MTLEAAESATRRGVACSLRVGSGLGRPVRCLALSSIASPPVIQPRQATAPMQLTIRRPDVPLELAPRIDVFPGEGLHDERTVNDRRRHRRLPCRLLRTTPSTTSHPPPALPVAFHPTLRRGSRMIGGRIAIVKPAVQRGRRALSNSRPRYAGIIASVYWATSSEPAKFLRPTGMCFRVLTAAGWCNHYAAARETRTDLQPVAAPRPLWRAGP